LYDNEPCEGVSDPIQQSLILGGQAQMWGETVDPSDLQNTSKSASHKSTYAFLKK
jgi:hexosaminidase